MKIDERKEVRYDSPEAATYKTGLSGWVNRSGQFWGEDEHMARWSGCTHQLCGCGAVIEKGRGRCRSCQGTKDMVTYHALPVEKWDGTTPLCVFNEERFFFGEDVLDYLADHPEPEEVRICKCKPGYLGQISSENWCDDLPEDGELPGEVEAAVEALNKVIAAAGPVCWWEDAIAIDVADLRARIAR